MKIKFSVPFVLILFCLLSGCPETIIEGNDPLDPIKDDPTTVGNFMTSKFDGFWLVTNLEIDWGNPPVLDFPSMLYIFRENTFQRVAGRRDWSDVNDIGKLSEMTISWEPFEFMYSNAAIYEFLYYTNNWRKKNYVLSPDMKSLSFGKDQMIKIYPEWTKEDLIGNSWYYIEDILWAYLYHLFTFTEDTLYIQTHEWFEDGSLSENYDAFNTPIRLTGDSFTLIESINSDNIIYYYIVLDKLIFSNGEVLHPLQY